jgi:hypothetical protein
VTDVNVLKDSVTVLLESEVTVEVLANELQTQPVAVVEQEKAPEPQSKPSGKSRRNRGKRRAQPEEEAMPAD